jgi:hypothetical protein
MRTILWAPRVLAVAVSLFLAVFSLDEITGTTNIFEALPYVMIHLLPSAIVLAVVALSWRREWIGAVLFVALAAAYAVAARAHLSWVAVISGPLIVAGALYAWSWMHRQAATA